MSSLNKVFLMGRLGKDPDIRYMPDGSPVANLSLATSSVSGKDKKEYTEWHKVVAFNKAAEVIGKYTQKGSLLFIEGSLSTKKWTDKNGVERYTTEIIVGVVKFLSGKGEESKEEPKADYSAKDYAKATGKDIDEEIPF